MSRSAPLTVLGLRISGALAEYFAYAARRIHPDVRLVTKGGTVAYDALLQSREAGGTWVLAFFVLRWINEIVSMSEFALNIVIALGLGLCQPLAVLAGVAARSASIFSRRPGIRAHRGTRSRRTRTAGCRPAGAA